MGWTALITILALVAGWALNEVTRRLNTRTEDARAHREFQRNTLLELQEDVNAVGRATFRVSIADHKNELDSGAWTPASDDEEAKDLRWAMQRAHILSSRLDSPALRDECSDLLSEAPTVQIAENFAQSSHITLAIGEKTVVLIEKLGAEARSLSGTKED